MAYDDFSERLGRVREAIAGAQARAGVSASVTIVAVTKTHGPEAVRAAVEGGIPDVGENRVQEAVAKRDQVGLSGIRWHLIGSLQSNKVRHCVGRFALIHSVDRVSLVAELGRRVPLDSPQPLLVEVNIAGESQKGGVSPDRLGDLLESLDAHPQLRVDGLMTMAPLAASEVVQRRCFSALRELRDRYATFERPLKELSMGMSGDFPAAVAEGATLIRIGTLLFGERV